MKLSRRQGKSKLETTWIMIKDLHIDGLIVSNNYSEIIAQKFHDTSIIFNLKGAESFEKLVTDLRASPTFEHDVALASTSR